MVQRGKNTRRGGDDEGEQRCGDGELQREPHSVEQLCGHGSPGGVGDPEVTLSSSPDPADELDRERTVEPELDPGLPNLGGRRLLVQRPAQELLRRITRCQVDERERQQRYPDQRRKTSSTRLSAYAVTR